MDECSYDNEALCSVRHVTRVLPRGDGGRSSVVAITLKWVHWDFHDDNVK